MTRSPRTPPERIASAGSAIAALIVLAASARAQTTSPNVLLITIDTVRADHVGAYGAATGATPAIDRLAREGVRFADATSQAPLTGPAHTAILTGQYPARLGVRDNASTPIPNGTSTLATVLKGRGYRTGGFVGAFILGPEYGFAQGFDTFDATFAKFTAGMKLQAQRRAGEVTAAALKWLDLETPPPTAGRAPRTPWFAWVHYYDAHSPYDPPAPFKTRFARTPYDGEIAYVDSNVAKLIAALEQSGQLDRTLVAVVADHGEGLGDHGEQEHGLFLYESVLHVPWIMRLPGRASAGAVVRTQVRAIDVMPTIAAAVGAAAVRTDGQNVLPFVAGPAPRDPAPSYAETLYPKWHFGWSELKSVRVGDWKYIDAPKPELYDMRGDAGERKNAIDARGPLAGGLSAALTKIAGTFGAAATADAPQPDPETLARLRSLGYVGIAAPSPTGRGPDPKDMVPKLEMFKTGISRAMDALGRGDADYAVTELTKLIAINDRSYELHLFLGDAYAARQQWDQALGEYAAARVLNAHSAAPFVSEARIFLSQRDVPKAADALEAAARIEPTSGEVAVVRGSILEAQGRSLDAVAQYEAAVRANGSDAQARAHLASVAMDLKRYDVAKAQFEALIKLGYRPGRMHFGLAQIAEATGDAKTAAAEYRLALRIEPNFAPARAALARLPQ
ncbi:MAG TPA: sulfatase-like hydrolase/transferase [Vicinamibacterales bacterium]|nr:sulfatase-like hydrolase/transferase [Vicinamibacterales bacterium]